MEKVKLFISFLILFILITACQNVQLKPAQELVGTERPFSTKSSNPLSIEPITSTQNFITPSSAILVETTPGEYTVPITRLPRLTSTIPPKTATPFPSDYWMSLPVIPEVSQTAREIYQRGIDSGRNSHAFSKIGDCQSITTYFISYFELPGFYDLGEYSDLQETIDWFSGSFSRESLAVKGGFNAAAILSPLRADQKNCNPDENPIACEFRQHNPSIAIISLEEWWAGHPENYEKYMRQIIEYTIINNIVPIIATKADNLEGNHVINQTIVRLALEYDIPLWNFWLAVQPLDNHGLISVDSVGAVDLFHLTHSDNYYFYDDPTAGKSGWSVRNLTALQALDAVWRDLTEQP